MRGCLFAIIFLISSVSLADDISNAAIRALMSVHGIDQAKCDASAIESKMLSSSTILKTLGTGYSLRTVLITWNKASCTTEATSEKCLVALDNDFGKDFRKAANSVGGCAVPHDWSYRLALAAQCKVGLIKENNADRSQKPCAFHVNSCQDTSVSLKGLNFKCQKSINANTEHADRTPYYDCPSELKDCQPFKGGITEDSMLGGEKLFTEGTGTN